jgi:hypothetical protein
MGLHETKKLLHSKRNEEAAHRKGEKSLASLHLARD